MKRSDRKKRAMWLAVLDAAGVLGGSSLFDATAVFGDDLVAWYSVKDTSTLYQDSAGTTPAGIGDVVGRWADKSGNGHHLTQATTAAKPQLTADGILTDGTDDYMTVDFGQTFAQPLTHFLVMRNVTTDATGDHYDGITSSTRNNLYQSGMPPQMNIYSGVILNIGSTSSERVLYTSIYDSTDSLCRRNSIQLAAGNAGTHSLTGIRLAARYDIARHVANEYLEYVVVSARATTQQIETTESQLAAQYGITL